jgi:hypothetical protein
LGFDRVLDCDRKAKEEHAIVIGERKKRRKKVHFI